MDNNDHKINLDMSLTSSPTQEVFFSTYDGLGANQNSRISKLIPNLPFAKVRDVKSPTRGTGLSAGLDFYIPNDFKEVTLFPDEDILIASGIHVNMSGPIISDYMLMAADKSGIATKKKLKVAAKIVDADYQGEIHLHVYNFGRDMITLKPGDKLVQFILVPVLYSQPEELSLEDLYKETTERGSGGFGSTGNL